MKTRISMLLSVTLALALPAAAQAALPKTANTLIVPAKSIGGLALGSSPTQVTKAWGTSKQCEYQCLYEGANSGERAQALLESKDDGVTYKTWNLTISAANIEGTTKPNFKTPLTRFKTSKGIGIGSTVSELRRAYPKVKKYSSVYYALSGPGQSMTIFGLTTGSRLTYIVVESHPGG